MHTSDARFRYAAEHEHELTGRQREVLDLIAAGRTNPEIAAALGISLNGAKWYVGEVLSKLGFDSREQAAAFRHLQSTPAHRAIGILGAVFGRPLLTRIVPLGAVLLVAAIGLGLASARRDDDRVDALLIEYATGEADGVVRWWIVDEDHWRMEHRSRQAGANAVQVQAANGTIQWRYSNLAESYQESPSASYGDLGGGDTPGPLTAVALGWLEGRAIPDGVRPPELLGKELVLGRPARLFRIFTGPEAETYGYTWVDIETGHVLRTRRWLSPSPGWVDRTLTASRFERVQVSADLFESTPAERAHRSPERCSTSTTITELSPEASAHLATIFAQTPPGLRAMPASLGQRVAVGRAVTLACTTGGQSHAAPWDVPVLDSSWSYAPEAAIPEMTLVVTQSSRPSVPEHYRVGTPVVIAGHEGYLDQRNGETALSWSDGAVFFRLWSTDATTDELRAILDQIR